MVNGRLDIDVFADLFGLSVWGYIKNQKVWDNGDEIMAGIRERIDYELPENFQLHPEAVHSVVKRAFDYVDKWKMYNEMWGEKK